MLASLQDPSTMEQFLRDVLFPNRSPKLVEGRKADEVKIKEKEPKAQTLHSAGTKGQGNGQLCIPGR